MAAPPCNPSPCEAETELPQVGDLNNTLSPKYTVLSFDPFLKSLTVNDPIRYTVGLPENNPIWANLSRFSNSFSDLHILLGWTASLQRLRVAY